MVIFDMLIFLTTVIFRFLILRVCLQQSLVISTYGWVKPTCFTELNRKIYLICFLPCISLSLFFYSFGCCPKPDSVLCSTLGFLFHLQSSFPIILAVGLLVCPVLTSMPKSEGVDSPSLYHLTPPHSCQDLHLCCPVDFFFKNTLNEIYTKLSAESIFNSFVNETNNREGTLISWCVVTQVNLPIISSNIW